MLCHSKSIRSLSRNLRGDDLICRNSEYTERNAQRNHVCLSVLGRPQSMMIIPRHFGIHYMHGTRINRAKQVPVSVCCGPLSHKYTQTYSYTSIFHPYKIFVGKLAIFSGKSLDH